MLAFLLAESLNPASTPSLASPILDDSIFSMLMGRAGHSHGFVGAWVHVDLANGRLEMMMVLLFVMWSKRFMVGKTRWGAGHWC